MVGLDVGGVRDLVDRELLALTVSTELFPDGWNRAVCNGSGTGAATAETVSVARRPAPFLTTA